MIQPISPTESQPRVNERHINVKEYSVNQLNGNFEDINFIEIENESESNDLVLNQVDKSGKTNQDFSNLYFSWNKKI